MNDIQRYAPWPQEWPQEDPNGDLVTYEDHKKIVDALEAKVKKLRKERDDALTFLDNAVSKAPEPLKALGKYLAGRLDEDEWPTAEQYLNAAAKACADHTEAAEAEVEKLRVLLEGWLELASHCDIAEGVCCCGESMEGHSNPMDCGHTPLDHGTYIAVQLGEETRAALTTEADNEP